MKNSIGKALKQIRQEKNIKQKDLVSDNLSLSQLANIEKSIHIPSTDKFIYLLDRFNSTYDEFLNHLDNTYLINKKLLKEKFIESAKAENIVVLEELLKETNTLFEKCGDIFFKHLELQILASISLIKDNYDFGKAREYIEQIKKYFTKIETWGMYELSLLNNCLYMFEIEDVVIFGNQIISSINYDSTLYHNKDIICILLNNFALYTLDSKKHWLFSLKCSTFSEEIAFITQNMTKIARAKILKQLAYYNLKNGKFDREELLSLINVFFVVGLQNTHSSFIKICKKHGIEID